MVLYPPQLLQQRSWNISCRKCPSKYLHKKVNQKQDFQNIEILSGLKHTRSYILSHETENQIQNLLYVFENWLGKSMSENSLTSHALSIWFSVSYDSVLLLVCFRPLRILIFWKSWFWLTILCKYFEGHFRHEVFHECCCKSCGG